jgi:putative PIN family toxin of toxin-antitoxin system
MQQSSLPPNLENAYLIFITSVKVVYSSKAMEELEEVLCRNKFDNYLTAEEKDRFLVSFKEISVIVDTSSVVKDCRDPKDNKFIELAIDGSDDYIITITGDPDLLVLHPYRGISIVTPSQFLSILMAEK